MAMVTVYTDASLCHETGAGGWGAWIRREADRRVVGAEFKNPIRGSNTAEMAAAANAIAAAVKLCMAGPGDVVVLVSDSQSVVERLFGRPDEAAHPAHGRMVAKAREIALTNGLTIVVKKVKAHSSNDGPRSYVNRLVDTEAKRQMRAARARGLGEQQPLSASSVGSPRSAPAERLRPAQERLAPVRHLATRNSLEVAAALWSAGLMTRREVQEAVAAVAARERHRTPEDWAESCARCGLIQYALPVSHPDEAMRQSSQVTAEEFASVVLRSRTGPDDLLATLRTGSFPQAPETQGAADGLVVAALSRAGRDGVTFLDPSGSRTWFSASEIGTAPQDGPAPGMR